jgi:hypothetical protein
MQCRAEYDGGAAARERRREKRDERFGGLRAPGICAAQTPCCADQLDVSLHVYTGFSGAMTPGPETASVLLLSNRNAATTSAP